MVLYFPVSDLTHLLTSLILGHPLLFLSVGFSTLTLPTPNLPCFFFFFFQTPNLVSCPFTFPFLVHPISKLLYHPDLAHSPLFSSYFPRLTLLFGSLPLLFLFFFHS